MPGAGSIVSAAAIANTLPKDGTQIGAIYASAMLEPLLGDGSRLKYDPSKFQNLGSASREVYTCAVRNDAPAKTLADARKVELIVGATAEGGTTVDYPAMSNAFLGTKFKVVRGYKGSREVTLAMERGEVQALRPRVVDALGAVPAPVRGQDIHHVRAGGHGRTPGA